MADIIVRPTMKFIKAGYFGVLLFIALVFVLCATNGWSFLIPACFLVLFIWPLERHVKNKTIKMAITEDKLRYERGLLSKTVETIQLIKVQDVRVKQSFAQRLLRVGSIEIETAGGDPPLTLLPPYQPPPTTDTILQPGDTPRARPGTRAAP